MSLTVENKQEIMEKYARENGTMALSFPTIVAAGPNAARPHHHREPGPSVALLEDLITYAVLAVALVLAVSGCTDAAGYDLDHLSGRVSFLTGMRTTVAYTPNTMPRLPAERRRRVVAVLEQEGSATFEGLMRRLGWTERALLETLVEMKANGIIEEDLNLETGEWMVRVGDVDAVGTAGSLMLADRQGARVERIAATSSSRLASNSPVGVSSAASPSSAAPSASPLPSITVMKVGSASTIA